MFSDPTAIDITTDPLKRTMEGVAVASNQFFVVSFMTQMDDNLWQGGCDRGLTLPNDIMHVVSLFPWMKYDVEHELDSYLEWRMYDTEGVVDGPLVIRLAQWVNECRKTGPVLVHCQAGLNRSALVTATALVLEGWDPAEAIQMMREKRSDAVLCNRSFARWLLEDSERMIDGW